MEDLYYTIEDEFEAELKDRGSKFIAYLFPMGDLEDFNIKMAELKSSHLKARHHCFAYRLLDTTQFRYSDDGEPSGTAGKPIYNQLLKYDLVNVGCIIVRYFGGTKLGTSGLINAYKESTAASINKANILEKYLTNHIHINFDYSVMGKLMKTIKDLNLDIAKTDFGAEPNLNIKVKRSETELKLTAIKAHYLGRSTSDITDETVIEELNFELIEL